MIDTYVINRDKNIETWYTVKKKIPWKLIRVSAIDGEKVEHCPFFTSPVIYAQLMSHRKVWQMVVENKKPALVLDDDCHPDDDFEKKMTSLINTLPQDYDIAILGYFASDIRRDYLITAMNAPFFKRRCMKKVNHDWFIPGYFMGSHCYIVTPIGAEKLLAKSSIRRIDFMMSADKNIVLYCSEQSIVTQTYKQSPPNNLTWKNLMLEPVGGMGRFWTVRNYHISFILLFMITMAIIVKNPMYRIFVKIVVVILFIHYLSTVVHISHNLQVEKDTLDEHTKIHKFLHKLNDVCAFTASFLLIGIGIRNHLLIEIIDISLLFNICRIMLIYWFPLEDPSGYCEEKSVAKYSFFEYCGTLRVSGHIFPSILLTYFMPKLGLFFIFFQTIFILLSKSHYPNDIVLGICLSIFVIYVYKIRLFRKRPLRCKQKNCLF